ncbi:hypothetical protein GCM10027271_46280 [Saccharopolyspora gloriosae]
MLSVVPPRYLAQRIARADETAEHAADQLYRLRMLEVSQLVRDVLPTADALVVSVRSKAPEGFQVHAVLAADEQPLWSSGDPAPTSAPNDWGEVCAQVGYALASSLGNRSPQDRWPQSGSGDTESYIVQLHGDDEIAAAMSVSPGELAVKLHDKEDDHPLWLVEPTTTPTMTVGEVHITAHIGGNGHLMVDVTRERTTANRWKTGAEVEIDVRIDGMNVFPAAS